MRTLGLIGVGLLLALLQGSLYRLFDPLGRVVNDWFGVSTVGGSPSLVLPLVVYLGVHELSMPRGALISFALGYLIDVFSGAPLGLFTFVLVAVWWLSRVAGVRLTAQTKLTQMSLAFFFALIEAAIVLMLLAIFGADAHRPAELVGVVVPHALVTALFAPFVFAVAARVHGAAGASSSGGPP